MGGKAFNQHVPADAFPRIPTAVYEVVKARLLARLQLLYRRVGVPFEAPEKPDHGDLDFLVVGTSLGTDGNDTSTPARQISHEDVKDALGATMSIHLDGNRTSNFAIPIDKAEWNDVDGEDIYYQVDVHVCVDDDEWERIFFYHSYGDLGMILGLLARNIGLALGTKGLKMLDPPNPPFQLCSSFPRILYFLGLSFDTWKQGFPTKQQVFEWVATSKYFDPASFKVEGEGIHKVKRDRKLYAEFVLWVDTMRERRELQRVALGEDPCRKDPPALKEEALVYFNKKKEFEDLAHSRTARTRLKKVFGTQKVIDWTGLSHNWAMLRSITRGIKERLGGDDGILKCWEEKGEEELQRITLAVKEELELTGGLTKPFAEDTIHKG